MASLCQVYLRNLCVLDDNDGDDEENIDNLMNGSETNLVAGQLLRI